MDFHDLRKVYALRQLQIYVLLLIFTLSSFTIPAMPCHAQSSTRDFEIKVEINDTLDRSMERFGIPGASIAVVRNGEIIYRRNFGIAHREENRPVDDSTVFSLYSVTKIFVATGIFQLIDQGKLNVDDKVSEHLSDLPDGWKEVTIRNLLTHSSGLPAIAPYGELSENEARDRVYQDPFVFKTGSVFRYTQTNYWLLRRIINNLSGMTLEQFILENQFGSPAADSVLFIDNNIDRLDVRAKSYLPDKNRELKPATFVGPEFLLGAGGLNLTMDEFIMWNQRFDDGELTRHATKSVMWSPFNYSEQDFPMACGWGIYPLNKSVSYGFTGGGRVGFRKFPDQNLAVFVLTNGYKYGFSADRIINRLAGIVDAELDDKSCLVEDMLFASFNTRSQPEAVSDFRKIRERYPQANLEETLNYLGYDFMSRSRYKVATAIFKLNTEEYPGSSNVWDSLAEACDRTGNVASAIVNYEKSLELNPENQNAKAAISRLKY